MLATNVRIGGRWLLAAAAATVIGGWLHCHGAQATEGYWAQLVPPRLHHVELHVKLKRQGAAPAVLGSFARPLFTQLPSGTHDDRSRWMRIDVSARQPGALVASLERDPAVEEAFEAPVAELPAGDAPEAVADAQPAGAARLMTGGTRPSHWRTRPSNSAPSPDDRCPITTPSFESYQGYLGPAPQGIDAPAAWQRGYRGAGVWFADVEGGWNSEHEDLHGDRITHLAGIPIKEPHWRAHGTAVLGEVVGVDNGRGVVGIAPDVERVFTVSIQGLSIADAIDRAAAPLRAGDVLLIELHMHGPRGRYLPVEYWDDNFDAILAATQRGVVVIEAAGNGGENLDHAAYRGKLDRTRRDSGAIVVGAGAPPRQGFTDRTRLDFSNYGSRVDVQGWGRKVATLDYGDLQACATADRHYTGEFAGTSSASPIVAGAAVILEGIARQQGRPMPPRELRDLLRATGTPQAGDTRKPIGPRPDLARAIAAMR